MPFKPITEDHAILNASFAIGLSQPLPWDAISALIKGPDDWRRDLPALELPQMLDVQANPQTGALQHRVQRGVEFSHKRPDGSASWQLNVMGTEIRVGTTLYTRWQPTWEKAGDILLAAAGLLAVSMDQIRRPTVQAVALQVTDLFVAEEHDPDYSRLFRPNDEIPNSIFAKGRLWHSHTGWFVGRPAGNILNQLNVDVKVGATEEVPGIPDDQVKVAIQHSQFYRPTQALPFDASVEAALHDLTKVEMPVMHEANKSILRSLLTEEMQARIKVAG
jgi:uncharacterized protein (TIGR04255 family)